MSTNEDINYHYKEEQQQPLPSSPPQQTMNSPELEREIYEKWLKKCQEDASYNRKATEQNNFDRIKFSREVLNQVGNIPDPEQTKLYTPYMRMGGDDKKQISAYERNIYQRRNNENEYDMYTLDGYPRHNYAQFYDQNMNGYGIKRGSTDITNLAKFERLNNGTYDEYRAKQQEILNFNVNKANDNLRYKDYIIGEKKKMGEERMKENERIRQLEYEEKLYEDEKKRVYKNLLDNQVKVKIPSKIGSLFYSNDFKDNIVKFKDPSLYLTTPENSFMNRNKLVEINPYSMKRGELGNSDLEHNPILNPVFNYKYNKYLFPRANSLMTFKSNGQNVVNKNG
jgi:hypothetical protein